MTIRVDVNGSDQHSVFMEEKLSLKELLAAQKQSGSAGNHGNVKLSVVLTSTIRSFCGSNTLGDIPEDNSRLGTEGNMQIEVTGYGQQRTVLVQRAPLKDLLPAQEKSGSSWNETKARFAAVLSSVVSSLCAFNSIGDIPEDDSRLGKEAMIRIELNGSNQRCAFLGQCLTLKELLDTQEKPKYEFKKAWATCVPVLVDPFW